MQHRLLQFIGPRQVAIVDDELPAPGIGQVLVAAIASAISAGTELLVYRGEAPADLALDTTISALVGHFVYPFSYGYAAVGRVIALGTAVDSAWRDRLVFAFQPHASHFLATVSELHPIESDPLAAVFLPSLETAVNLTLDGRPLVGERVVVIGQGIVGLLTTSLLKQFPLGDLITLDPIATRRDWSLRLGARCSLDPANGSDRLLSRLGDARADLTFEVSGNPVALDLAITATGDSGRVVIGSWYGRKPVSLALGGRFHRSKMTLIASQVSNVAPALAGRWTPYRRLATAATLLDNLRVTQLITHRFEFSDAGEAYRLLDQNRDDVLQVILVYGGE